MISALISWAIFVGFAIVVYFVLKIVLETRDIANKLLVVASAEFFEMADKLMKTPDELPDSVLNALETMMNSMNNGEGSRVLLHLLREFNSEN